MTMDWDLLDQCCEEAAINKMVDSDCTNMPARPDDEGGNMASYGEEKPEEWKEGVVQVCVGGGGLAEGAVPNARVGPRKTAGAMRMMAVTSHKTGWCTCVCVRGGGG
jgi:hypothetical protein